MRGLEIRQYVLEEKLGEGGMAEVWKASDAAHRNYIAVKFLVEQYADNPDVAARFVTEAERQSRLHHPNIVAAFDFVYVERRPFLLMPFIDGASLDQILFELQAPMPIEDALPICRDVLAALEYAHSQHIVHRDIKPSNIMVDKARRAMVLDFGVALARGERRLTKAGRTVGTPHFMSPEQIMASPMVDARADIYGFGCVLYQMLTGSYVFDADKALGELSYLVKNKHLSETPRPPRELNPAIPAHVEAAILCCLEKDPGKRFASCADLLHALEDPFWEQGSAYVPTEVDAPATTEFVPQLTPPVPPVAVVTPIPPPSSGSCVDSAAFVRPTEPLPPPASVRQSGDRRIPRIAVLATVSLALLAAGGFWFYRHFLEPPKAALARVLHSGGNSPKSPTPSGPSGRPDPFSQAVPPASKGAGPTPPASSPPADSPSADAPPSPPVPVSPPPPPAAPKPVNHPPAAAVKYDGPNSGSLVWSGHLMRNEVIEIDGLLANSGLVTGAALPGLPVHVTSETIRAVVLAQPDSGGGFRRFRFRAVVPGNGRITFKWNIFNDGKFQVRLTTSPIPANSWYR